MHLPTWVIGPITRLAEYGYDRLATHVGIRVESNLGFAQQGGQSSDYLIVTVYNRTDTPEMVESVFLMFSKEAGALFIPNPVGPFPKPPQIVSRTQNFVFGFPLDQVQQQVRAKRVQLKQPRLTIAAAGVHLASGRRVTRKVSFKLPD